MILTFVIPMTANANPVSIQALGGSHPSPYLAFFGNPKF